VRPNNLSRWIVLRRRLVRDANRLVAPLENSLLAEVNREVGHRPIFIVGPPRSGTTLLTQVLTGHCDVGYLTNLHNAVWGAPAVVEQLVHPLRWRGAPDYRSTFGNTRSWLGESEAPNYWLRFFPERPHFVAEDDVEPDRLRALRAAVRRLVRAFGRDIVFKTINNTGRVRPIAAALPEALFIVSRRQPLATARSILEARHSYFGTFDRWWSLESPGWQELAARPAHEQAAEQVLRTYEALDEARRAIGAERFVDVRYESLCDDPRSVLEEIKAFTAIPAAHNASPLPERFPRDGRVGIPAELDESLSDYLRRRLARQIHHPADAREAAAQKHA